MAVDQINLLNSIYYLYYSGLFNLIEDTTYRNCLNTQLNKIVLLILLDEF